MIRFSFEYKIKVKVKDYMQHVCNDKLKILKLNTVHISDKYCKFKSGQCRSETNQTLLKLCLFFNNSCFFPCSFCLFINIHNNNATNDKTYALKLNNNVKKRISKWRMNRQQFSPSLGICWAYYLFFN